MHIHLDNLIHTGHTEEVLTFFLKKNKSQNKPAIQFTRSPSIMSMRMLRSRSRLTLKTNQFFLLFFPCRVRLLTHLCHSRPCTAQCIMLPGASGLRYQFWRSPLTVNGTLVWGTSLHEGVILVCSAWQYQNKTSHTSAKCALASEPEAELRFGVFWTLFWVIFSICSENIQTNLHLNNLKLIF